MAQQSFRTYFAIPNVEEGISEWDNFKQIEKWGKVHKFKSFKVNGKLFLIKDTQIIVYEKIWEKKNGKNKRRRIKFFKGIKKGISKQTFFYGLSHDL